MYFVVSDKLYLSLILLSYPRCLQTCSMYVFCGGAGLGRVLEVQRGMNIFSVWDAAERFRLRPEAGIVPVSRSDLNSEWLGVRRWSSVCLVVSFWGGKLKQRLSQFIERVVGGGGEGGMKCTLFFLYLGFNLLNISKSAASDSSVCGSSMSSFSSALPSKTADIFSTSLKQLTQVPEWKRFKKRGRKNCYCLLLSYIQAVWIWSVIIHFLIIRVVTRTL